VSPGLTQDFGGFGTKHIREPHIHDYNLRPFSPGNGNFVGGISASKYLEAGDLQEVFFQHPVVCIVIDNQCSILHLTPPSAAFMDAIGKVNLISVPLSAP